MREAAAVLVVRKGRVLGFLQYAREGVSIPCGWVEGGETPLVAAVRECQEETGYQIVVTNDAPYQGFDPVGKTVVTTYRAEIIGVGKPTTPHEGKASWVSIRTLTEGPFGHYNQRMLRHFGINPWPLVGKFHSHLTLRGSEEEVRRAAKLVGGKVTYIDLSRMDSTRKQTDAMVTNHYLTGAHGLEDEHDVLNLLKAKAKQLVDSGIEVTRVKLEYDVYGKKSPVSDAGRALQRLPYTEVHIKTIIPHKQEKVDDLLGSLMDEGPKVDHELRSQVMTLAGERGWHPSRNPFDNNAKGLTQFVNRRFYVEDGPFTWETVDRQIDEVVRAIRGKGVQVKEIKYETAIYDSNDDVDRWWMA